MQPKLLLIRFAYWTGILLDAGAAMLLMAPALLSQFFDYRSYAPSPALFSIAGVAAALMWGWTFLLFWADRRQVERRGVLLLTVFPVLAGIAASRLLDAQAGLVQWFPGGLLQPLLAVLFLAAYFAARSLAGQPGELQR